MAPSCRSGSCGAAATQRRALAAVPRRPAGAGTTVGAAPSPSRAECTACASSGDSSCSPWPAHDRLGVGARLGTPVDGAEHHAVAHRVEQREGERQLPGHLVQRVVPDDRDIPQRPRVDGAVRPDGALHQVTALADGPRGPPARGHARPRRRSPRPRPRLQQSRSLSRISTIPVTHSGYQRAAASAATGTGRV